MEDDWTPVGRNMKRRERAHRAAKHNDKNRRRGAQAGTHLGGRAHRRAHRAAVAEDTLRVLAEDPAAYAAAEGTVQHGEDPPVFDKPAARDTAVAFECCTTLHACRRIVLEQGHRCAALVFGSAKNPGGGFLKGALAQEESIAAASALYWCTHDAELYARNDADPRRNLYHNLALYCPDVPVIKDDDGIAVHRHTISMVVCPAPNAGAARASKVPGRAQQGPGRHAGPARGVVPARTGPACQDSKCRGVLVPAPHRMWCGWR